MRLSPNYPPLLATALPGFFKPVEQAAGVGSCEGFQPVVLTLLDGITGDGTLGTKEFCFLLHLAVPHVLVEFADVHEYAHLRNRLELGGGGSHMYPGKAVTDRKYC